MDIHLSTNPLANNRAMESGVLEVWITGQVLQQPLENTRFVPPGENARIPGSGFETAGADHTMARLCGPATALLSEADDCRFFGTLGAGFAG